MPEKFGSDSQERDPQQPSLWMAMREHQFGPEALLVHFELKKPPISVEWIAKAIGVRVHPVRKAPWSGAVQVRGGQADIWVSMEESGLRRRFTLAHELGHLLLHPLENLVAAYRDYPEGNPNLSAREEIQANHFASDLLMPLDMVQTYVSEYGPNVPRLASAFQVSEGAMRIRLKKLLGR